MWIKLAPAVLAGIAFSAHAVTVSLNPSKDNTLFEDSLGSVSNATGPLFSGVTAGGTRHRAVMAFDLSSIPAGATINSATLTLTVSKAGFGGASTFTLYPLLADWGEGTSIGSGGGGSATAGDATWIHRFYNTSTWTTPGGDFSVTGVGSVSMGSVGSYSISGALLASSVQSWLTSPGNNFGWLLKSNEAVNGSSLRIESRESLTSSSRPRLTIDYSVASTGSSWQGDSDGEWSDPSRWSAGVPDAAGAEAIFGSINSVTRSVHLSSPRTVGTLTLNSSNTWQITGSSTLTFDASGSNVYLNVQTGSHDLQTPVTAAAGRKLIKTGNGSVKVNLQSLTSMLINSGTVSLNPGGGVTSIGSVDFAGGKLDLRTATLRVDDGVATQRSMIRSFLATGLIVSSTGSGDMGVGYLDQGPTRVDVLALLKADSNGDGKVNTLDFNNLAGSFGSSGTFWRSGDFNYDGTTDSTDFNILTGNYGKSLAAAPLGATVPEPASSVALLLGSGLLSLRKRVSRR